MHNFRVRERLRAQQAHGELYPLPPPPGCEKTDGIGAPHYAKQRQQRRIKRLQQDYDCVGSLNQLAAATVETNGQLGPVHYGDPRNSAAVESVLKDIRRRVKMCGPCPPDLCESGALRELLSTKSQYMLEPANIAQYDPQRLKVLKGVSRPKDIARFLPPGPAGMLRHFKSCVERPADELDALFNGHSLPKPHWDEKLASDKAARHEFFRMLAKHGLLSFRRKIKAKIGFFFVHKTSGDIRLIVDARQPNMCHKPPPRTQLGSVGSMAELDLSEESWEEMCASGGSHAATESSAQASSDDSGFDPHGATADVDDCFYQFRNLELASWFGIDELLRPWDFGVYTAYDDELGGFAPIGSDELLFPVFEAVPMGWTWALHLCNEAIAKLAEAAVGGTDQDTRLLREKCCPPQLAPGKPVVAVYVDNFTTIAGNRKDTVRALTGFNKGAAAAEVGVHGMDARDVAKYFDSLGVDIYLSSSTMRNKSRRIWRTALAGRALARRKRIHLCELQVWVGHAIHLFALDRPGMAGLQMVYPFMEELRDGPKPMSPAVAAEIRLCCNLFFLGEHSMRCEFCPDVYCTDSSGFAWAMLSTKPARADIMEAARHRERWRFKQVEVFDVEPHLNPEFSEFISGRQTVDGKPFDANEPAYVDVAVRGFKPCAVGPKTKFGAWAEQKSKQVPKSRSTIKPRRADTVEVEMPMVVPPLAPLWSERKRWKAVLAQRWQFTDEHINLKEARTSLRALRREARSVHSHGKNLLTIGDNLVSICAFEKGRSRAWGLNAIARRSAAYQIGCKIQWRQRHIVSDRCVADDGSRLVDPEFGQRPSSRVKPLQERATSFHAAEQPSLATGSSEPSFSTSLNYQRADKGEAFNDADRDQVRSSSLRSSQESSVSAPRLALELYAGTGVYTQALVESGLRVVKPFEIKDGAEFDLGRRSTQQLVLQWIRSGKIWSVHLGTPCTIWSIARRGIKNQQRARDKERAGVEAAIFSAEVIRECNRCKVFWSVENPATSKLFQFDPIAELQALPGFHEVVFNMCMYGTDSRKPTRIWTNAPFLSGLGRRCDGQHVHTQLSGNVRVRDANGQWRWRSRTELAGEYPQPLTQHWAELLRSNAPPGAATATSDDPLFLGEWVSSLLSLVPHRGLKAKQTKS